MELDPGDVTYATLILAAWCYYSDKGINENKEPLEIIDAMKNELHKTAKITQNDTLSFLRQSEIFNDLIENEQFTKKYVEMVQSIYGGKSIRKFDFDCYQVLSISWMDTIKTTKIPLFALTY